MEYGIFEDLAARHLAAHYGVFIKRNWHPPERKSWDVEIDIVGIDLANRVIIMGEVKAGGLGTLPSTLHRYSGEVLDHVRLYFSALGELGGIDFSTWEFRPVFYVRGSFLGDLEKAIALVPGRNWDVFCLEDTLMLDIKPDRLMHTPRPI